MRQDWWVWAVSLWLFIGAAVAAHGAQATATWSPSTGATGYKLYYGTASMSYSTVLDVGPATSASIDGLTVGETYFFAATAYNSAGESGFSNEASKTILGDPADDPPTVAITQPANGAMVARKSTVTITATASDDVGVSAVDIRVNGSVLCRDQVAPYACAWRVPAGNPGRTFTLDAVATDTAGQQTVSAPVTVRTQ